MPTCKRTWSYKYMTEVVPCIAPSFQVLLVVVQRTTRTAASPRYPSLELEMNLRDVWSCIITVKTPTSIVHLKTSRRFVSSSYPRLIQAPAHEQQTTCKTRGPAAAQKRGSSSQGSLYIVLGLYTQANNTPSRMEVAVVVVVVAVEQIGRMAA